MNVGSLFSGIGGIELGLERVGFNTKWFIEKDEHARAILKQRFPRATIYEDVQKVHYRELEVVDILTGGFPCQDLSKAGKGKGLEGSRSGLWRYYFKAIREIRPKFAIIENVPNLLKKGFCSVLTDLATIGYNAEWQCLPVSAFGGLHRRQRLFIVAYPNSYGCIGIFGTKIEKRCNLDKINFTLTEGLAVGSWPFKPCVGRVVDGIPRRVDRIKRLGNSVCPIVAQSIGAAIKKYM